MGEFRDEGYLPDAMTNFLALLGWNEGDGSQREMYSLDELVQAFSLGRITKSGAVFDKTKLSWMNGALAMGVCLTIRVIDEAVHVSLSSSSTPRCMPSDTASKSVQAEIAYMLLLG